MYLMAAFLGRRRIMYMFSPYELSKDAWNFWTVFWLNLAIVFSRHWFCLLSWLSCKSLKVCMYNIVQVLGLRWHLWAHIHPQDWHDSIDMYQSNASTFNKIRIRASKEVLPSPIHCHSNADIRLLPSPIHCHSNADIRYAPSPFDNAVCSHQGVPSYRMIGNVVNNLLVCSCSSRFPFSYCSELRGHHNFFQVLPTPILCHRADIRYAPSPFDNAVCSHQGVPSYRTIGKFVYKLLVCSRSCRLPFSYCSGCG